MANILPVSDLRNYNEVLKNCHKGDLWQIRKSSDVSWNGFGSFKTSQLLDRL